MKKILLAALTAVFVAAPALGAANQPHHKSNAPTRGAKPLAPTRVDGRFVAKDCAHKTVKHNDRGQCVRDIQWLLTSADPAWRPKYARKKGQHGANIDRKYWRIRPGKPTGHYGRATVLQVQRAKFRLGYPSGRANGAAGPKLRAYLLGRPLPSSYVNSKENRYQAWRKAREGPGPKVKHLLALANQAISWHDHYYYTQSPHRSDFLTGLGPPWPKGGDCSGSVSALYKLAGLPATGSVFPYDWTGSMQDRGRVVWHAGESLAKLKPGDLVFYGYGAPYTHVAMEISPGRVYTFGHQGCPCNAAVLYRDDARIARRYF